MSSNIRNPISLCCQWETLRNRGESSFNIFFKCQSWKEITKKERKKSSCFFLFIFEFSWRKNYIYFYKEKLFPPVFTNSKALCYHWLLWLRASKVLNNIGTKLSRNLPKVINKISVPEKLWLVDRNMGRFRILKRELWVVCIITCNTTHFFST